MDLDHDFSEQIIGLGHKVVIPDLNNDGLYGLSSFRNAGFRWLVAVPLMTYRVHGILGIASRNRKTFQKETAELIMVIAGLIGNALSKANLEHCFPNGKKTGKTTASEPLEKTVTPEDKKPEETFKKEIKPEAAAAIILPASPPVKNTPRKSEPVLLSHPIKRKTYRELHPRK